ncbi:THAP7 protein, partial [Rhinopomastus cyanomelas]|nr:THAP7 protein [Rhinopomastus cyanomelas]
PAPHSLPQRDIGRRAQWLQNSRRQDPTGRGCWDPVSKYIYFCSQHFDKSCFEIVGFSGYHRLKEGAIPTVFSSTPHRSPRTPKLRPPPADSDAPKPPGTPKRWRLGDPPIPGNPQFAAEVSCFPVDSEDPTAPPAGDHGEVPALPGLLGARGTFVDQTGDQEGEEIQPLITSVFSIADCRPPSPSVYMLRLPAPPGSYIQSEHSYQVGSALLWKR